ncbi:MAG TPA: rRNA maturation RNase YbeY [Terriglobia bacterium]
MILNQQNTANVDLTGAEDFAARLRQVLALGDRDFNICFVDDLQIRKLNTTYRGQACPTDVLSFRWSTSEAPDERGPNREFAGFLGDVVISVETARRNAEAEGHTASTEISWLILHGLLHLLGMDHETDHGEMAALELGLRARLGMEGQTQPSNPPRAAGRKSRVAGFARSKRGLKRGNRRRPAPKPTSGSTAGRH